MKVYPLEPLHGPPAKNLCTSLSKQNYRKKHEWKLDKRGQRRRFFLNIKFFLSTFSIFNRATDENHETKNWHFLRFGEKKNEWNIFHKKLSSNVPRENKNWEIRKSFFSFLSNDIFRLGLIKMRERDTLRVKEEGVE